MNTDDIMKKYGAKIESQLRGYQAPSQTQFSQSYEKFRGSMIPSFSRYEKWCKAFGNFFHMKVAEKDKKSIDRSIEIAHLNLTSSEVVVFAVVVLFLTLFGGLLAIVAGWLLTADVANFSTFPMGLSFLVVVISMFLFYYSYKAPQRLAQQWRLKASAQMVPAILYIVIYMKHTSNFEKAVAFAAEHLQEPLSLDFRKVFWDVEVGKFSTIKDSIDNYLETWRDYSVEFIEAFHLIESSLYEPSEDRRVVILEKSLQVILDGVYDKMLKYTHNVKSPLTNLYMLGIVLPTLSLAILPLASTMLQGMIKWYHVLIVFDLLIPFLVLYLTTNVMAERPGGYGETSLLEKNPLYPKYKSNKAYVWGVLIMIPLLILGFLPILWAYTDLPFWLNMQRDYSWSSIGVGFLGETGIFGIITDTSGAISGPFGILSLLLSLLIPFSIALMFIIVYHSKTKELIVERGKYKQVEKEFTSSLFQLGNRMGDGTPAEIAFAKVAESSKGTETEGFFRLVNQNIQHLGMSLEQALFNPKRGAVIFYPSELISTSMKILIESVKKGLQVAARSLMSISDYVKNIKKINARLNDLLADIISDMKSNMNFLAPMLSGIIIGLAGMITSILAALDSMFKAGGLSGAGGEEILGAGGLSGIMGIFDITTMIPPYWLQITVGIYLIEIIFILTATLVTLRSGRDKLASTNEIGKNLKISMALYILIATGAIIGLSLIGAVALQGLV